MMADHHDSICGKRRPVIAMGAFGVYQSSISLGNIFKGDYNSLFNYICFLYNVLAGRCVYSCNSSA